MYTKYKNKKTLIPKDSNPICKVGEFVQNLWFKFKTKLMQNSYITEYIYLIIYLGKSKKVYFTTARNNLTEPTGEFHKNNFDFNTSIADLWSILMARTDDFRALQFSILESLRP